MGLIITLILGGFIGWLASRLMGRDEGIIMSVIIGVIGSLLGSWLSSLITGADRAFLDFSWMGLFWSFIGAIILVAIMNAFWHPRGHSAQL